MNIKITVNCHFCQGRFEVTPIVLGGELITDDIDGSACCSTCLCPGCGRGHFDDADYEKCWAELGETESEWIDPDGAYDAIRDSFLGV